MMRDSSVDGAQIDVQVPPKTLGSDVTVDVVQELPCVVRYRVPSRNKSKASVQNQVKLQDYNDCSKVSAVLRQNMLTIKAPVQEKKESMEQRKSRVIPVTEHD
jgi:HSP20 family molecular chaperone IbpA